MHEGNSSMRGLHTKIGKGRFAEAVAFCSLGTSNEIGDLAGERHKNTKVGNLKSQNKMNFKSITNA